MMQVLYQLSKELGQTDVSLVRFNPKSSTCTNSIINSPAGISSIAESTSDILVESASKSNTLPSSASVSSAVSTTGSHNHLHQHHRSKTRRDARSPLMTDSSKFSNDLILIECRNEQIIGGIFITLDVLYLFLYYNKIIIIALIII